MNFRPGGEVFALGSAFFAGLTAVFGKMGVEGINSNLATFIRTAVIMVIIAGIDAAGYRDCDPSRITGIPTPCHD